VQDREGEPPAGPRHAGDGGERAAQVIDVGEPEAADGGVEPGAGQPVCGSGVGLQVADAGGLAALSLGGLGDQGGGDVDPRDDGAAAGQLARDPAMAAGQIQRPLASHVPAQAQQRPGDRIVTGIGPALRIEIGDSVITCLHHEDHTTTATGSDDRHRGRRGK